MEVILAKDKQVHYSQREVPTISPTECLVKVAYAGLNRADILQKNGLYPPPPGETDILGLEFSGVIVELGSEVKTYAIGDKVCSIVGSGAYAEYLKVESKHLIKLPRNLSLKDGGAIPEAFITAYQALVHIAKLSKNERLLIHAGASGVGAAAIQMAKAIGAEVIVTASGPKHQFCYDLGADSCIDYKKEKFSELEPKADVVLDLIGGSYFQGNIDVLQVEGRMVMLGFLGGVKASEANIAGIVTKRLRIQGSTLRARSKDYKAELIGGFIDHFMKEGVFPFKTNVDRVFDFKDAKKAHLYMEENRNKGKILISLQN